MVLMQQLGHLLFQQGSSLANEFMMTALTLFCKHTICITECNKGEMTRWQSYRLQLPGSHKHQNYIACNPILSLKSTYIIK